MRELEKSEAAIQVWSYKDPGANELESLISRIIDKISNDPGYGLFVETEGPTPHIPDFFDELYGTIYGYLIYVKNPDLDKLKNLAMELELENGDRIADIDIYLSYFTKIYRSK